MPETENIQPEQQSVTLELLRIVQDMDNKLEARKSRTDELFRKLNDIEVNVSSLQDSLNQHIEETKRGTFCSIVSRFLGITHGQH
jgi:hypothetical protein